MPSIPAGRSRSAPSSIAPTCRSPTNEVVLTFDDGPLPGTTDRVLDALRDACTHATFFTVGRMAKAYPDVLRRAAADGNTIATHTWRHPLSLARLSVDAATREIDRGIAAVTAVLGHAPAPFFRFPGLGQTRTLRNRLTARGIAVFSADVVGDDWTGISADAIRRKVLMRLKLHHGGIVLLHDTKHATARMLPQLLKDMKAAGYRIVHIVPAAAGTPVAWRSRRRRSLPAASPRPRHRDRPRRRSSQLPGSASLHL